MTDEIIHFILPALDQLQGTGYWVAFFAALVETALVVGLFIPGSTLLLLLGALSASGHLDFTTLLWFAVTGAIIGDMAQLWLSRAGLLLAAILVLSLLLLWFKRFIFRYGQQWLRFAISIWHSVRTAVATNPEVVRLVDRYPRVFAFLAARMNRQHFSGLPLTLWGLPPCINHVSRHPHRSRYNGLPVILFSFSKHTFQPTPKPRSGSGSSR